MVPAGEVEPLGQLLQPVNFSSLAQYWFAPHLSTRSSERSSSRRMGAVSSSRRMEAVSSSRRMGAVRVVAIRAAARAHVIRNRIFFYRAVAGCGASTILQRWAALQRRHQASAIATHQRFRRAYATCSNCTPASPRAPQRPRSIHTLRYQHTDRNRNSATPVRYIRNLRLDDDRSKILGAYGAYRARR